MGKKGGSGFPHIAVMSARGDVLAIHRDSRDVAGFGRTMTKALETKMELASLQKKAKAGDADAGREYFMQRFDLGHFSVAEAHDRLKKVKLGDDEHKEVLERLLDMEIEEVFSSVTGDFNTRIAAGKKCCAMMMAGRTPKDSGVEQGFWILIMDYAESEKDPVTYEKGMEAVKALLSDMLENPAIKTFFDEKQKMLEELRMAQQD